MSGSPPVTRPSLLARLADAADAAAWGEFVTAYGGLVYGEFRRRGFPHADAEDLTQRVFARLVTGFRTFRYAPGRGRFRDWLGTVVRNEASRYWRERSRHAAATPPDVLEETAAGESDPEWVDTFHAHVLRAALDRVRPRFEPATWAAFAAVWLDGRPADEAAADAGKPVDWVYVAKSRVLAAVAEAVQELTDDLF